MQMPYSYDSITITAQCRAIDRMHEVAREHQIAAAPQPPAWQLFAAVGRRCVRAGEWLQRLAQPTRPTMPTLAKEQV